MSGLDYKELDSWMKELDVLQQELRMIPPHSKRPEPVHMTNGSIPNMNLNRQLSNHSPVMFVTGSAKTNGRIPERTADPGWNNNNTTKNGTTPVYPTRMRQSRTDYDLRRSQINHVQPLPNPPYMGQNSMGTCTSSVPVVPDKLSQRDRHREMIPRSTTENNRRYRHLTPTENGREQKSVHWSKELENAPPQTSQSTQKRVPIKDHRREQNPNPSPLPRSHHLQPGQVIPINPLVEHPRHPVSPAPVQHPPPDYVIRLSRSRSFTPIQHPNRTPSPYYESFPFPINLAEFTQKGPTTPMPTASSITSTDTSNQSRGPFKNSISPPFTEPNLDWGDGSMIESTKLMSSITSNGAVIVPPILASPATSDSTRLVGAGGNGLFSRFQSYSKRNSVTSREVEDVKTDQVDSRSKLILRVYQPDRTTKAVSIEDHTTAFDVLQTLIEKNVLPCSTKHALVEKIPSLKLERCFEDDELVMDCLINWNLSSENLIFFEEREDVYGMFENPRVWLSDQLLNSDGRTDYQSIRDLFTLRHELNLPTYSEHLYVRTNETNWKRRFCLLRNSGLYVSKHNSKDISAFHRIVAFKPYLHLYTTTGGWTKIQAPTPYGFNIRAGLQLLQNYENRLMRVEHQNHQNLPPIIPHDRASDVATFQTPTLIPNRPRAISLHRFQSERRTCDSVDFERSSLSHEATLSRTNSGSQSGLGCVSGRPDVRPCSQSVSDLVERPGTTSRGSSVCASSLGSLFACSSGNRKVDEGHEERGSGCERETNFICPNGANGKMSTRMLKKKKKHGWTRIGPAARRCSRSISQISTPFDVVLPNWVREGSQSHQNLHGEAV